MLKEQAAITLAGCTQLAEAAFTDLVQNMEISTSAFTVQSEVLVDSPSMRVVIEATVLMESTGLPTILSWRQAS